MGDAQTLAQLRQQIRAIEGGAPVVTRRAPIGLPALDALTGGLPRPGLTELHGPDGCGVVRLALQLVAAEVRAGQRVVWFDLPRTLHPPAAVAAGVQPEQLLIVRPPDAALHSGMAAWAIEQGLGSGCFRLVVTVLPEATRLGEPRALVSRWRRAAEQGDCAALFVTRARATSRWLGADLRLGLEGRRLAVLRDRQRGVGAITLLPPWPTAMDPWDAHLRA